MSDSESDGIKVHIGNIEQQTGSLDNEVKQIANKTKNQSKNESSRSQSKPNDTTVPLIIKPRLIQAAQGQITSGPKRRNRSRTQRARSVARSSHSVQSSAAMGSDKYKRGRESGDTPPNVQTPNKKAATKKQHTAMPPVSSQIRLIGMAPPAVSSNFLSETPKPNIDKHQAGTSTQKSTSSEVTKVDGPTSGTALNATVAVDTVESTQHNSINTNIADKDLMELSASVEHLSVESNVVTNADVPSGGNDGQNELVAQNAGDNPNFPDNQQASTLSQPQPGTSYANVTAQGSLTVAIIDQRQSDTMTLLDQYKFNKLRSIIGDKILSQAEKKKSLPRIVDSRLANGAMKVHCGDMNTRRWLVHCATTLQSKDLWSGAKLKVIDFCDLPKPHKFQAFFPGIQKSSMDIFKLIERLNGGISTKSWSVLNRELKRGGTSMVIGVGSESYNSLTDRNRQILCGLGTATFTLIKGCPANKDAAKNNTQHANLPSNDLRNRINKAGGHGKPQNHGKNKGKKTHKKNQHPKGAGTEQEH